MSNSTNGLHLFVAMLAVGCNVVAQIGLQRAAIRTLWSLEPWLQPSVWLALGAYGVSFALTGWLLARYPLSVIVPAMAGAIFLALLAYDTLVLGLHMPASRLLGMGLIVAGVFVVQQSHA